MILIEKIKFWNSIFRVCYVQIKKENRFGLKQQYDMSDIYKIIKYRPENDL